MSGGQGFGWVQGAKHVQAEWDASSSRHAMELALVQKSQSDATVRVVTQYVDRLKTVRETSDVIIKEVPVYVSPAADSACVLPNGFVSLHDAAAAGRLPESAGGADATPSGVALSAAASAVAENYQRCHENAEQLTALQLWISEMAAATQAPAH